MKFILILFLLFFACNSKKDHSTQIFRYNEHKNIGSLDPAFAKDNADIWAVNQLFNGLVQMDEHLNVQPCIAKQWQISQDALTYTFSLRNDVFFHKHDLFGKNATR
ncbi:MAG: ABC transporter substrate-binding protein, partial [Xanthomarina gelatinilytica]|nr:ABC transporter substrate-binding protein [Xanthomarina gelatinilytica]